MNNISRLFNLREGEDDRAKTLENVSKNIYFKGANLWILSCAIIVASVGLNVNSTAVIIGAMLISPLMGPIVGAGFALGVYDFTLLKKSLQNLFNATIVSLAVSTVYFYLTPFKDVQSELLARTAPNIYDIIIAFFGGIVGVIAVTRVEKGNPVPGVAIATALMPPLCTAGYGIATAQWAYFIGAFYLYCINCVFIGIATFAIIKYLNYPAKKQVDSRQQKQVRIIITLLSLIMLLPAGYLAYSLYNEQQFKKNADMFIEEEFTQKGYTVIYKKTDYSRSRKKLEVATLSKRFNGSEISGLKKLLAEKKYLQGTELIIRQDTTDHFRELKGDILNQIRSGENEVNAKDVQIAALEKKISDNTFDNRKILLEASILFTEINAISINRLNFALPKDSTSIKTTVIYKSGKPLNAKNKEKFKDWMSKRLSVQDISVIRDEN